MPTLTIVLLGAIVAAIVLAPLLSKQLKQGEKFSQAAELEQEKDNVFSELSDLEYDYQMGKVSGRDYDRTKAELYRQAALFVKAPQEEKENVEQKVDQEITVYLQKRHVIPVRRMKKE